MVRVKRGVSCKFKHKKVIKLSKGYINRRKNNFTISKQAVIKSFTYSYRDRKNKKRFFKSCWIIFINSFLKNYGFNYSFLINCLNKYFIDFNKKSIFNIFLFNYDLIKFINIIFFYYYYEYI
ncbi:50S ribosomal protein L20 [Candidatus Nasuia deltocephalinicola]|uniref:50S ribosomal protein L20 n=1 Tax=Candidatus Nasuia deltocephalincola TaxID=1160784 RepID=UPI00216B12C1|nr:50S ribosomal protein L20 [Candidatus Nasuia deltocephalinicola]